MRFFAAVVWLCAAPLCANPVAKIDAFVAGKIQAHLIPGLALVVIRDGEVLHRQGFGELKPQTPIIIGSLSKSITATAVMQLVDAGKIDLDQPMQTYLGALRFRDLKAATITVRQLLNQTSGIPTDAPRAANQDASLAEHVAALTAVQLVAAPGEQHIYASPNYQILGRIVELISGEDFGSYVQRAILTPLQMRQSTVNPMLAPQLATGHNLWWGFTGPSSYRFEPGRLPTASIIASADDLGKFAVSQLGLGPQLLSDASLELMHRGTLPANGFSYAMGWRAGTTAGVPSLWHGGALPSYRGAMVLLPDSRSAVIVLTNISSLFADHTREIAAGVVAILAEKPLPAFGRPLRTTYMGIALIALVLLAWQLRGLMRAIRQQGALARRPVIIVMDFLIPIGVLVFLPRLAGVSYQGIWEAAPDLVVSSLLLMLLGMATGLAKWRRRIAM